MNTSIEPELLSSPPRTLRRHRGIGWKYGCFQLFILPHTIVGIGLIGALLLYLAVLTVGTRVPATITHLNYTRSTKGIEAFTAYITYRLNGTSYNAQKDISATQYSLARTGQTVSIKVLPILPETGSILFISGSRPWGTGIWILPFALGWNGFLAFSYFSIYGGRWKEKALIRCGTPVRGRIG